MEFQDKTRRFNLLLSGMDAVYHEAALRLGISDSVMLILYTICTYGDSCLLSDLLMTTAMSKQTANSALRKLEAEDIVMLESSGGRKKRVCLTAAGRLLADRTAEVVIRMENEVFNGWHEEEWEAYFGLTERFIKEMNQKVKEISK